MSDLKDVIMITSNEKREWKSLADFTVDDIDIEICLDTLSHNQRWAGKLPFDWSILDHCLMCHRIAEIQGEDLEVQFYAFMHDFPESLTGDIISPIKKLIKNYDKQIELPILKLFYSKFSIKFDLTEEEIKRVKDIDKMCAEIEEMAAFHNLIECRTVSGPEYRKYSKILFKTISMSDEEYNEYIDSILSNLVPAIKSAQSIF